MKKLFVLLAVMAFALTPCLAQTGKVNNFKIKRGTNVSHWLSQSEARGEMRRLHIQEEDFARLEKLGFDFVRIPIDEAPPPCHCRSAHRTFTLFQCSQRRQG